MANPDSQYGEPLSVYLAARSARRLELQNVAEALTTDGFYVVSSWLADNEAGTARSQSASAGAASRNLEDLGRCDIFVAFSERPESSLQGRGGRQVELGFALALGKRVLLVGPPEHVFHHLLAVERHNDWQSARRALRG